jgi:hypothetical protein
MGCDGLSVYQGCDTICHAPAFLMRSSPRLGRSCKQPAHEAPCPAAIKFPASPDQSYSAENRDINF